MTRRESIHTHYCHIQVSTHALRKLPPHPINMARVDELPELVIGRLCCSPCIVDVTSQKFWILVFATIVAITARSSTKMLSLTRVYEQLVVTFYDIFEKFLLNDIYFSKSPALLPSVPTCCCSSTVLVATNLRRSDRALLALMLIDQ
uniref:Uncharacterized protein n=1 Tax=Glossina austeni TaxID=7395 RepID=A0A1A9UFH9_GLOAU